MFLYRIKTVVRMFFTLAHKNLQLLRGIWKITKIRQPIVSIFGGSHLNYEDPYTQLAHNLAKKLVEHDISVMTGGGPGIMEAASCGAVAFGKEGVTSLGIGVTELNELRNPCVQEYFEVSDFASRKWLLTRFAIGFVVFPGGYGTLDELAEILTLMKTKKLPQVPIILIGKEYWHFFMHWLTSEALKHNVITAENLRMFQVTDDLDEACMALCESKTIKEKKEQLS